MHLLSYPMGKMAVPFGDKIEYAQFLHDGSEIKFSKDGNGVWSLTLPILKPDSEIPVVEIYLK